MENFIWGRLVYIFKPPTNRLSLSRNKPVYNPSNSPSKKVKVGYGISDTDDSPGSLQFMPRFTEAFDKIQCEDINISERDSYEEIDLEMIRNIWVEKVRSGGVEPSFPITPSCHIGDNSQE